MFIAVCIITFRRQASLARLLNALSHQNISGHHLTAVVIDNDSFGSARETALKISEGTGLELRYRIEPRQGTAFARSAALDTVPDDAEFICFLRDDERPSENWLAQLVQRQDYHPERVARGRAVPLLTQLSSPASIHRDECARRILGVDVSVFSHPQAAMQELEERIARGTPTRVAFFNANLANKSYEDPRLRETLRSFLIFNDGVGVDLASLILYRQSFPYNLNGTDFVPSFLENTRRGLRLALIGARPEVIQQAARAIESRWPKHRVVVLQDGYFTDNEENALAEKLREARPDVVLVGMGNPRQEEWLARNIPLVCNLGIGVGALFDFLADHVPRAPLVIRRARLEWLYRLALEPRRLGKRYTIDLVTFLLRILREATQFSSRV